ncbi:MAG TPA: hypothetical protein VHP12_01155 [Chitinophagaceae bacterium]|nr:hypothetical protein [Chitinophagaceae bacterium]
MKNKIITADLEWKEGKVKNFFGKELINSENGIVKLVKIASDPDEKTIVYAASE